MNLTRSLRGSEQPRASQKSRSGLTFVATAAVVLGVGPFLGNYHAGLLVQAFIFAILAVLTDLVWGYLGVLTFASAAMFGIGAYALGMAFVHFEPSPSVAAIAILAGIVASGLLSALIGWLSFYSRSKVTEFYVSVVTLGISLLFGQVVLYGGAATGGSNGLSGFSTLNISNSVWYLIAAVALFAFAFSALKMVNSDFGLVLRSVRDNEMRCRYLGMKTPLLKTAVFAVSNAAMSIAGVLYALHTTVVAPSLVSMTFATNVLIWVILGGRATIIGPAIAAVIITVITPQLTTSMPLYWQGLLGLTFVLVVVFLPRGLLPAAWDLMTRPFNRSSKAQHIAAAALGPFFQETQQSAHAESGSRVLDIKNVSKRFGKFQALADVSFGVKRGELLSIVGPNGAGKTSLVKCIADGDERSAGTISIGGRSIERHPPDVIASMGVARKFQAASIFESLTVGECIKIATWKGEVPSMWARSTQISLPSGAAEVVRSLGLEAVWNTRARDISHGQRQALELAMVLALKPSVLILDEPTAGLSAHERGKVGEVLTRLAATGQLAIILIEHDFEFVKRISSRIIVLVSGKLVADGTVAEVSDSAIVRDAYLGRSHHGTAK